MNTMNTVKTFCKTTSDYLYAVDTTGDAWKKNPRNGRVYRQPFGEVVKGTARRIYADGRIEPTNENMPGGVWRELGTDTLPAEAQAKFSAIAAEYQAKKNKDDADRKAAYADRMNARLEELMSMPAGAYEVELRVTEHHWHFSGSDSIRDNYKFFWVNAQNGYSAYTQAVQNFLNGGHPRCSPLFYSDELHSTVRHICGEA